MLTMAYFSGLSDCESLRHTHLSFEHYNNKFSLPFPVFADLSVLTIARGFFFSSFSLSFDFTNYNLLYTQK